MDLMNVFRGLKKSHSGPNLTFSERISFSRKSKREKDRSETVTSPLPPRPPSSRAASLSSGKSGRPAIDNIPENRVYESASSPGGVLVQDDDLYAGKENGGRSSVCPGCRATFDTGKQRRLRDSCGHERCYTCIFQTDRCPLCSGEITPTLHSSVTNLGNRPLSPAASLNRGIDPDCVYGSVNGLGSTRSIAGPSTRSVSVTPPMYKKNINPSPAYHRRNWIQRHTRRPMTMDDAAMSDDASSTTSSKPPVSSRSSLSHPAAPRSSFSHPAAARRRDPSTGRAYSAGQESGFQSRSSLLSLNPSLTSGPISTLTDSNKDFNVDLLEGLDNTDTESLASFSSNLSLQPPNHHQILSPLPPSSVLGGRRNSMSRLTRASSESVTRVHQMRRSARQPTRTDQLHQRGPLLQYRPVQWFLKPLYFEVPQRHAEPNIFVGRDWIYREISEQLQSSLPTNRGVLICGAPGTGKTRIILNLVERSSFGNRADCVYSHQEPVYTRLTKGSSGSQLSLAQGGGSSIYGTCSSSSAPLQHPSLASQVVAYHFCQVENYVTCQVAEWIHSLAAQLSQAPQLESYHSLLSTDHDLRSKLSLAKCLSDPDTALKEGILAPLVSLQKSGKLTFTANSNAIILLDALCDAEFHRPDYGYTLAQFIARHLGTFPGWLKIVCTVRTSSKQSCAANLPFHNISLDNYDVDERLQKDIGDYINYRIQESERIQTNLIPTSRQLPSSRLLGSEADQQASPATRFQAHVLSSAKGSFLFVKLLLDLVEKGSIPIKSSFKVLPQTLAQIFMLEFNLRFPTTQSFQTVSSMLSVCLASLQPLTLPQIYLAVLATNLDHEEAGCQITTGLSWTQFLNIYNNQLSDFLVKRKDDSICFFHPLFREWLIRRSEKDSVKFLCDPRQGHIALALSLCRSQKSLGPDKSLELAHHILKSNIYKNQTSGIPTRDLLASWISLVSDDISLALSSERNLFSPSINLSKLILLSGANPNQTTMHLNNAPLLCVFAERGYTELVSLLLEYGADPDTSNADGFTAVTYSCISGNLECLRILVEAGAMVTKVDNTESCALVHAARHGHLALLEYLISLDWEECTCPGGTCGMPTCKKRNSLGELAQQAAVAASAAGNLEILEFLLDMREVEVNRPDTLLGETLLGAAAASGRRDCCQALIKRGARLTSSNLREATPLHQAAREGHWSVCELLLSEGAPVEQKDALGRTPLISAAMEGHLGIVEHLVTVRRSDMDVQDKDGMSALMWACSRGKLETIKFLIGHKADITGVDKKGRTALDHSATHGDSDVVAFLLDSGAMMEHVDINGMRALDRSIACGNIDVVKCFLKKGAKLGPTTWNMANRKPEIMLCLLNKLLEDGNTLYRRNKLEEAGIRYQYALKRLPSPVIGKFQKVFDQLKIHLLLNLSRCRRKMKIYAEAVDHASEVIKSYPHVYEAYQTRARAHQAAGDLQAAYQDFSSAVRLAPQNRELHRDLLSIKEELQSPSKPLPDSMFNMCTSATSHPPPTSPRHATPCSPLHTSPTQVSPSRPNPLVIKEHRRLAEELKDVDSSGSTSSGVGSSL